MKVGIGIRGDWTIGSTGGGHDMAQRADILPISLPPRGLSRTEAAAYIGVSVSLFDMLVEDGRMPTPKRINSRTVWDRKQVDEAFELIPDGVTRECNPWDH